MTIAGWIFMSVSLAAVTGLVLTCYRKILSAPQETPDNPSDEQAGEK